jgi:TIR domain
MEVPGFMSSGTRPIVYISYRWIDIEHQSRPARAPDPRGLSLADQLRERGVDVRLDLYYRDSLHGFSPPQKVPGDPRDPWLAWSAQQIAEADAVLMVCTPDYVQADLDRGERFGEWSRWCELDESTRIQSRVPALWWDWLAISREIDFKPDKFIPVGFGPYHADLVPAFVRGANYQDLESPGTIDALLRRIRRVWRARVPRRGVFISYAHHDDRAWLDDLLRHLSWIRDRGVEIWTDRDIAPGALWHETIQAELDRARVAILMVSPAFLASPYISSEELPRMLEAAAGDGLTIFWIPVQPSAYRHNPIARFQAAHAPDKPLAGLRRAERDQAFVDIGEKLAKVLGVASG